MKRSFFVGNVVILTPFLLQALDEVLVDGKVKLLLKRFVEVVRPDQENHIAEVIIAPRRQFELN